MMKKKWLARWAMRGRIIEGGRRRRRRSHVEEEREEKRNKEVDKFRERRLKIEEK